MAIRALGFKVKNRSRTYSAAFSRPAIFAPGCTQHQVSIEAGFEFFLIRTIERFRAIVHGLFHFGNQGTFCGIGRRKGKPRDATLQVDGHPELFEQVHAEDAVNGAAAGFNHWTEIDGGQLQVPEFAVSRGELGNGNFAGAGRRSPGPRCDMDFPRAAGGERLRVEKGSGRGIHEEAHVGLVDTDSDDR